MSAMQLRPNALYQSDALALMERIESGTVAVVYLDPPWGVDGHQIDLLGDLSRRLQQARRILADSGLVCCHALPAISASFRYLIDQIFSGQNFRSEIILPRPPRSNATFLSQHEAIIVYSKSDNFHFEPPTRPLTKDEQAQLYRHADERGPYRLVDLTTPFDRPKNRFTWMGHALPPGRSWRYSEEVLQGLFNEGRIRVTENTRPMQKLYLAEKSGVPVGSIWDDLSALIPLSEQTDYVTQQPLSILTRLITMLSKPGDIVVDPLCGSGTAVVAAHLSGRRWIAGDHSKTAIEVTYNRLRQQCCLEPERDYGFGDQQSLEQEYERLDTRYVEVRTGFERQQVASGSQPVTGTGHRPRFVVNQPVPHEEDRGHEFKEVKGGNAIGVIENAADEYVVAYLNSSGGSIYWGVRDEDGVVVGVRLDFRQRNDLRRKVENKLHQIQPRVDPSQYQIHLHPVWDGDQRLPDVFVVEVVAPPVLRNDLYFTGGNEAFVKTHSGKKKLNGPEIVDWVLRRLRR